MTLREVLHAHIPMLKEDSTFRDAVDKMDIYQFPALVIVDAGMKPIGVVTEGDLCRAATTQDGALKLSSELAIRFASQEPITAGIDSEIGDALHQMLSGGITLLPVVDEDRLMGVVLRVDLLQAILADAANAATSAS
jgi:CBS domain-containing protein